MIDKYTRLYSVIIPVYNSEQVVATTVREVLKVMEQWRLAVEIVLINDGSPDKSWSVIRELAQQHDQIVAINLQRNFGQHSAVLCGMAHATGDYQITMDDDLQNPPKELIKLIDHITSTGDDLVFARFTAKRHAGYRRMGTKVINYINRKVFDKPKGLVLSNFRIFDKEVAKSAVRYKTYYPYIPGLLLMHAGRVSNVPTEHHARTIGGSNYSAAKIIQLVGRLLFNYSAYPLQLLTYVGFTVALFSFVFALFTIVKAYAIGSSVPGWTSLVVLLSLFNGITIGMLGMLGTYITRVLRELSTNSPYQVREIVSQKALPVTSEI